SRTTSRLFVLWLDEPQFEILDATKPNYDRRVLPLDDFPVVLTSGVPLPACFVYVGKHDLSDENGQALRLTEQAVLISRILAGLCGSTVLELLTHIQDAAVREAAYEIKGALVTRVLQRSIGTNCRIAYANSP
ncbi:hypothetical protein, partial [Acrocarpospora corrugata]